MVTQKKMKMFEIAKLAIEKQDARMAVNLVHYLNSRHNLNMVGVREYLELHGIDYADFDALLAEV